MGVILGSFIEKTPIVLLALVFLVAAVFCSYQFNKQKKLIDLHGSTISALKTEIQKIHEEMRKIRELSKF